MSTHCKHRAKQMQKKKKKCIIKYKGLFTLQEMCMCFSPDETGFSLKVCECVWVYPSHVHTPTHGHTHTWLQNIFEEYRGFNRRKGVNHFHLRLGIQTNKYIGLLKITEEKQCKVLLRLHNEVFYMRTKITRIIIMIMSVTLPKKTKECNLNNKNATCVWNTHKHIKKKIVFWFWVHFLLLAYICPSTDFLIF